ncbi:MAG: prepilin-type N-terminal cleavage/methylation domain-containing protein [Rickettsiales bacterium]|nr:prepilin-type N-terminal cleavage/methylation domain-containing protein [Rickettsiales bacterium]
MDLIRPHHPSDLPNSTKAFSLVELSIVLVILGLLVGGVLSGQSLIRAAELRSVTSEIQRIQTALRSFQDKYQAMPGDMPNAVRFWGAQIGATTDGVDATCSALTDAAPATGVATCNGNGNGQLGGYFSAVATTTYEHFRLWQQLANAGLIEGSYTGVSGGSANASTSVPGLNIMRGKLSTLGYLITYLGTCTACSGNLFDGNYGNIMIVGGQYANTSPYTPLFKPEEAWNIDTKIDDGKPGYGIMTASKPVTCTTSTTASSSEYLLTATGKTCFFFIGNM